MKPWKRIGPTTIHKVGWRTIVSKTFLLPDGKTAVFDTMRREGESAVVAIAVTPDKKVVLARQFRTGPEKVMDDLPVGLIDEGEAPEAAARRELREETGYIPGQMEYLGKLYRDPYSNLTLHVFLATGCTPHKDGQRLDETEDIEIKLANIDELFEKAKNAQMIEIASVFLAQDKLQKLRSNT